MLLLLSLYITVTHKNFGFLFAINALVVVVCCLFMFMFVLVLVGISAEYPVEQQWDCRKVFIFVGVVLRMVVVFVPAALQLSSFN